MNAGDTVKFLEPMNDDERTAEMVVIEMRGPHVLVTDTRFADWRIKPQSVYLACDLVAKGGA